MRHIPLTLIFTLLTFSPVVAQETKPQDQKPATPTTAESEKPKNEVDRMLDDIKKRGDKVFGACLENCSSAPITSGVENGKALHLPKPGYPRIARMGGASGEVTVQVIIGEEGTVIAAAAISGHPLLYGVSVAAARETKFTPTKLDGKPVKVVGVLRYNFVAQ
jgi:TonB family protein